MCPVWSVRCQERGVEQTPSEENRPLWVLPVWIQTIDNWLLLFCDTVSILEGETQLLSAGPTPWPLHCEVRVWEPEEQQFVRDSAACSRTPQQSGGWLIGLPCCFSAKDRGGTSSQLCVCATVKQHVVTKLRLLLYDHITLVVQFKYHHMRRVFYRY